MADKDDDFHGQVLGMAERLGLKGDDKRKYVHEHMTRGGYRMEPTYVPNEDEDEDEGSGFFGSSGRSRRRSDDDDDSGSRRSSGSRSRRSGRNSDWWSD